MEKASALFNQLVEKQERSDRIKAARKAKRKRPAREMSKRRRNLAKKKLREQIICCICSRKGMPVRDHDHITGKWRDVICAKCNLALGFINDDPAIAIQLAGYLKLWTAEHEKE